MSNYLPYFRLTPSDLRAAWALTLIEAKAHLRIESTYTEDDTYITQLIKIAQRLVEQECSIMLTAQEYKAIGDEWPSNNVIDLGVNGLSGISLKYYNTSDVQTTLIEGTDYELSGANLEQQSLMVYPIGSWPSLYDKPDSIEIVFTTGLRSSVITDEPVTYLLGQQAMYLIIGRYYEMRQDVVTGTMVSEVPLAAKHIMNQIKKVMIC